MEAQVNFFPLLVVSLLAALVPLILHRIPRVTVPIIVGEVIGGLVVGPNGFDLIRGENPYLDFLKLFGFTYLMFLSGLEIDFRVLARRGGREVPGVPRWAANPLGMSLGSFVVTLALATLFSLLLVRWGLATNAWVMALVLSTTSLGVVAPVLHERRLIRSPLGQHTLVASVVADLATVMLISAYVILHTQGLELELMFVLVLLMATFLVYRLASYSQRHLPLEELVEELSHATGQLDIRGALALAVVFIALSQGLGVEVILGAFLAGAIISLLSDEEAGGLRPKLHAIGYGFFIPVFFIMIGVDFDLPGLIETPTGLLLVPVLLVMAYAVKYAAAICYKPLFSWREVFGIGSLISARLSLIIAVAAIGVEIEAITRTTEAAIIIVAIFTVVVSPIVFTRIVPAGREDHRRVIIAGSAPQARLLAQRLHKHGELVSLMTRNEHLHQEIGDQGIDVVLVEEHGRSSDLEAAGITEAQALVSMLANVDEADRLLRVVREEYAVETVVAYVENPAEAEALSRNGVRVVDPSTSTVVMLEGLVRHPHSFELFAHTVIDRDVEDVRLTNHHLHDRPLREIPLPGDALVLLIFRNGEGMIPRGHTRLRFGDTVTLVGSSESLQETTRFLSSSRG